MASGVYNKPICIVRKFNPQCLVGQKNRPIDDSSLRARPYENRHVPFSLWSVPVLQVTKDALRQDQTATVSLHTDEGVTRLKNPGVHEGANRLTRRVLERVPEIRRLGVGVFMAAQVQANAVAKRFRAEILFEHAQHRRTFLVGQHIEHARRLLRLLYRKLDGPRALEAVDLHGRRA